MASCSLGHVHYTSGPSPCHRPGSEQSVRLDDRPPSFLGIFTLELRESRVLPSRQKAEGTNLELLQPLSKVVSPEREVKTRDVENSAAKECTDPFLSAPPGAARASDPSICVT